jgi:hypothetical protein
MVQVCLMGWWSLVFSCILYFSKICSIKDQNQLLSDTLLLIGEYLKLRATFLTQKTTRDEYLKQSFVLQHQINEKHETLRETLPPVNVLDVHYEEKQLLILLSSINIFELIEAKHLDYKMIDAIFGEHKNSKSFPRP